MITPAVELRVRVSIAPGEERDVVVEFTANPLQLAQLMASKTLVVLVHTSVGTVAVNATVR